MSIQTSKSDRKLAHEFYFNSTNGFQQDWIDGLNEAGEEIDEDVQTLAIRFATLRKHTEQEVLKLVKEAVKVDPWEEHLAGNPTARVLEGPGRCVEVHRKLVMEKLHKALASKGDDTDPEVDRLRTENKAMRQVIARLNHDGGHRMEEVGVEQASKEADAEVIRYMTENDALKAQAPQEQKE